MPSLLRGLKKNPEMEISAIVNVFDTGGSSGELKDKFGILPPGDILKCLLALAEDDVSARKILLKRVRGDDFGVSDDVAGNDLLPRPPKAEGFSGHTGGNILLLGLEKVYGDYRKAINALGQILSVAGRVIPVTLEHGTLSAEHNDGFISRGEVSVDAELRGGREITRLWLEPPVAGSKEAIEAIEAADAICVGPGSFYTSVLSNFLPKGISDAVRESTAPLIFISNLLTEGKGMRGYTVEKIVSIAEKYLGREIDFVIVNTRVPKGKILARYAEEEKYPLVPDVASFGSLPSRYVLEDLWLEEDIARHDSDRLAGVVARIVENL